MAKKALLTGVTGQDGSYLTELLLQKGYEVHGIVRRAITFNRWRLADVWSRPQLSGTRLFLHYGDLGDSGSLTRLYVWTWNVRALFTRPHLKNNLLPKAFLIIMAMRCAT